tara:strand:- start:488 stop:817 length:330 start_codon:yes stop_codon:yes gene_type:complete
MAFEQITSKQYAKAIDVIDDRLEWLEEFYPIYRELKKMRADFVRLYAMGNDAAIDYSEWQDKFDALNTSITTAFKTNREKKEEDDYGDGKGNNKVFSDEISSKIIKDTK